MSFDYRTKTIGVTEMFLLTVVLFSGVGVLSGTFCFSNYSFIFLSSVSAIFIFFSSVQNIAFYVFSGFGL